LFAKKPSPALTNIVAECAEEIFPARLRVNPIATFYWRFLRADCPLMWPFGNIFIKRNQLVIAQWLGLE
jgi:hypothetical protein